ncbi:Lipoate-protein ligase LplJ [bioreactor metagenome]|uniref:lipoate--protein ligase n=1 Tax=bioreactor metagenome TaxID=1076179 RepID=A0A644WQR0_9ZZZZ
MAITYIESPSTDPAFNLALEEYVFKNLPRDKTYFMLWQNDNAIIVGRHQNTAEEVNAVYVSEHNIKVVRRLSGGGAVYHDLGNLNYTFIADAKDAQVIDLQYFCLPLIRALEKLGVHAGMQGRNDIVIDGKKFSGNSQYIKDDRIMHHGTILFDSDLSVLSEALKADPEKFESKGVKSVRNRVTNLRPYLPEGTTLKQFREALLANMTEGEELETYTLSPADLMGVQKIRQGRYELWDWNYGVSPDYTVRRSKRFPSCGLVELRIQVVEGRIANLAVFGDFIGNGDADELAGELKGCRMERRALTAVLELIPVSWYFFDVSSEELVDLILL